MSYLVLDNNEVILAISDTIAYQDNGNALIKNATVAIPPVLFKEVIEVTTVDSGVEEMKYCYNVAKSFYVNPNYVAPVDPNAELTALKTAVLNLQTALAAEMGV